MIYICNCVPARIRHALAELPETLDETYERTLREINKENWKFAHRLFQFVAVASRPLRVEELADLLAFDFEAGPIPKFHEDWRLEDPVDAVLSACSSLLTVADVEGFPVVQFCHFSLKEFFTSTRLAEANDIILRRYHISMTRAHTLASLACLGILLHLDKDVVTGNSLKDLPLAEYAAKYWVDHIRFGDVSRNVDDGMKQLFDPSKPHLSICLWIHNPISPQNERAERPLPPPGLPLHYAASWGLHSVVEFLIIEHPQDVNSRILVDNATPLHLASRYGHIKVAGFLLERGADLTAQNKDKETPLHVASRWGDVEVAGVLIERGADVSAQDKDGETPLHLASRWGDVEVARTLIERGADVSAQDKDGETPLHVASRWGDVKVARVLIEHGAGVLVQDKDGETPLHLASRWGEVGVARMLIERGADVSAQNELGETPLYLASRWEHVEVAHMLIEHGADATSQNKERKTPLHLASTHSYRTTPQRLAEVARIPLEHGANITVQDNDGLTPLDLASQDNGLGEIADVLIEHGASPGTH